MYAFFFVHACCGCRLTRKTKQAVQISSRTMLEGDFNNYVGYMDIQRQYLFMNATLSVYPVRGRETIFENSPRGPASNDKHMTKTILKAG